eukprot:CAMPEP_0201520350 /NCGR_PEP_ID=MMETSP0161_2-20130828/10659_1 /ASSEMBLY_ACC=CAM_ASM_000251 /TAXON_ID=180227 /ORGANISM="Neoparamoeba aestuarina, Strain SoJaBio B1-5/56/2" /LENGTH=273 /DNA_ID=CAMNT_0047918671 /DNA_START=145 /DNA_END=966 /DNA_ORIENTATION=+
MWACFAIFWLIGFGFYCAKFDNVVFDGHPFYMTFKNTRNYPEGRKWPAWLICPGIGENATLKTHCDICDPPPKDDRPSGPQCTKLDGRAPSDEHDFVQNCVVYNNDGDKKDQYEGEASWISCDLDYKDVHKARVYLFDQQWPIMFEHGHPVLPNGAVMHTLPKFTRTLMEISREVYEFNSGNDEISFVLMDGETYNTPEDNDHDSTFMIYFGTYVDRVFTQSENKITTGYDFWYWIGFLGGISFFCYALHSLIYAGISIALGWKEDDGFTTLA